MNAIRGIVLFTWLPIAAILALIAWATRWWVAVIAVVYFGVTIGGLRLYRQRLKRRFENDPEGARAYTDRAQRRVFRWGKAAGLLYVGMLLGLLVLVIVIAAVGGHG
jgi:phosphatidylglycerophosphate synthase